MFECIILCSVGPDDHSTAVDRIQTSLKAVNKVVSLICFQRYLFNTTRVTVLLISLLIATKFLLLQLQHIVSEIK